MTHLLESLVFQSQLFLKLLVVRCLFLQIDLNVVDALIQNYQALFARHISLLQWLIDHS